MHFLINLLLILALPSLALTQETTTKNSGNTNPRAFKKGDIRCQCLSTFAYKKNEIFYIKLGEQYVQLRLKGEDVSRPFPLRNTRVFALYIKTVDAEENIVYKPIIQQPLTENGRDFLILLNRNGKSGLTAKPYDLSPKNLQPNKLHLFNETPVDLGLNIKSSFAKEFGQLVKPSRKFEYIFKKTGRDDYAAATISIFDPKQKKAVVMGFKNFRLIPGRRILLFCYPSKIRQELGATPMRMHAIQDIPKL